MAKTVLLGKEKEKKQKAQKKSAKGPNKKRRTPARYFKDIWNELKKVTWPTKEDLLNYSLAVLAFVAVMAVVVGLFDFGLGQLVSLVVSG